MLVLDKRNTSPLELFGSIPVGAVFKFPSDSEANEYYNYCMKINSADADENTIDLEDCAIFRTAPNEHIINLNAYLVVEGEK